MLAKIIAHAATRGERPPCSGAPSSVRARTGCGPILTCWSIRSATPDFLADTEDTGFLEDASKFSLQSRRPPPEEHAVLAASLANSATAPRPAFSPRSRPGGGKTPASGSRQRSSHPAESTQSGISRRVQGEPPIGGNVGEKDAAARRPRRRRGLWSRPDALLRKSG